MKREKSKYTYHFAEDSAAQSCSYFSGRLQTSLATD